MTLLGAIDDATGDILALYFRPTEDLHGYVTLCQQLFTTHGLPLALYGDRLNVLVRNDRHWSLAEELQGTRQPTHFGRILQELAVGYLGAHSPQAKGRIERLWQTLQDRLVSELRLAGISSLEAANAFLPAFIADYNRRFRVAPAVPTGAWRRPPRDLDRILSCRYACRVARDNTVTLGARWVQLPRAPHGASYVDRRVEIRELLDGRMLVFAEGRLLATQPAPPGAFTLKPRRAPSADRPRARARGGAQLPQERRSSPDPLPIYPPKFYPPKSTPTAPAHRWHPPADHPWRRAADLHRVHVRPGGPTICGPRREAGTVRPARSSGAPRP